MKFVDGLPLDVYRRQYGPLPFDEIIRILRDVADALDYAHEKKVIHRDVKPANIMLGETDGIQLIDFGLADDIRQSLTKTADVSVQKISGTRSFMAPEQWEGRKQDARTDQYALAVTAYELLAGHVPFSGADTEVLKNAVLHDMPAPIPDLPGSVNAALFRGLAKNRNDRFENCRAFVETLANPFKIQTEPPRLPPPLPPKAVKTRAWNRIVPALIAAMLLLSVLGFFLIRQSLKPTAKAVSETEAPGMNVSMYDPGSFPQGMDIEPRKRPEIRPANEAKPSPTQTIPTREDQLFAQNLASQRNQRSGLRQVVRITLAVDDRGNGHIIAKRGLSAEALPAFRGTPFDSDLFRNAMMFRGENGAGRILFPKGDVFPASKPGNPTTPEQTPWGWKYWSSGGDYDFQREKTRFSLHGNANRAGISLGKAGKLPCAITVELLDNNDSPPYFETILCGDEDGRNIICTISCWGEREENGRLRMTATLSHPFQEGERGMIAENVVVEKSMMLYKQFRLPSVVAEQAGWIKFNLWTQRKPDAPDAWSGFDLTLLDVVGRFKADAGFTVAERGNTPVVGKVDPTGPAKRLPPDAEILSINDQSGSASKLRETLDSLHFGDSVTVRFVPKGGGGSITSLFHAE